MKILYFSWIKDNIGKSEEEINLTGNVETITDLVNYLVSVNENYKKAFNDISLIKCSKNMNIVDFSEKISEKDEIAFFPPMTGGE